MCWTGTKISKNVINILMNIIEVVKSTQILLSGTKCRKRISNILDRKAFKLMLMILNYIKLETFNNRPWLKLQSWVIIKQEIKSYLLCRVWWNSTARRRLQLWSVSSSTSWQLNNTFSYTISKEQQRMIIVRLLLLSCAHNFNISKLRHCENLQETTKLVYRFRKTLRTNA